MDYTIYAKHPIAGERCTLEGDSTIYCIGLDRKVFQSTESKGPTHQTCSHYLEYADMPEESMTPEDVESSEEDFQKFYARFLENEQDKFLEKGKEKLRMRLQEQIDKLLELECQHIYLFKSGGIHALPAFDPKKTLKGMVIYSHIAIAGSKTPVEDKKFIKQDFLI